MINQPQHCCEFCHHVKATSMYLATYNKKVHACLGPMQLHSWYLCRSIWTKKAQEIKFEPPSALTQNIYPNSQTRTLYASFCCCDQSMLNVRHKDAVLVVIYYNCMGAIHCSREYKKHLHTLIFIHATKTTKLLVTTTILFLVYIYIC